MQKNQSTIGLVLDSGFGDRLQLLAQEMPVWVISSPANDIAMDQLSKEFYEGWITKILNRIGETSEDTLQRAMLAVEEHHGEESQRLPYTRLVVFGMTNISEEFISELGFISLTATKEGFTAEKC